MEWKELPAPSAPKPTHTPERPSQHVSKSEAPSTGKQNIVVTLERLSTGGTKRMVQMKRPAGRVMTGGERSKLGRLKASLFPSRHLLLREKDAERHRATREVERLAKPPAEPLPASEELAAGEEECEEEAVFETMTMVTRQRGEVTCRPLSVEERRHEEIRRREEKLRYNVEQRRSRFLPGFVDETALHGQDWWLDLDLGLRGDGTIWFGTYGAEVWCYGGIGPMHHTPWPLPPPPRPEKRLWLTVEELRNDELRQERTAEIRVHFEHMAKRRERDQQLEKRIHEVFGGYIGDWQRYDAIVREYKIGQCPCLVCHTERVSGRRVRPV